MESSSITNFSQEEDTTTVYNVFSSNINNLFSIKCNHLSWNNNTNKYDENPTDYDEIKELITKTLNEVYKEKNTQAFKLKDRKGYGLYYVDGKGTSIAIEGEKIHDNRYYKLTFIKNEIIYIIYYVL